MNIQGIDFVALPAKDMRRAEAFYRDVLGLTANHQFGDRFIEFAVGGMTLALFDPAAMGRPFEAVTGGGIALHVPDVAAAVAELEAKGVELLSAPFDSGVCHGAFFQDSEGNTLSFHHRYAPEPVT
jgi:catechol 2,3-dioxygenase-like lactoylglutathione lyase family enzyme